MQGTRVLILVSCQFSPHWWSLQLLKTKLFSPHVSFLFICRFRLSDQDTFPTSFHDLVMIIILPFMWNPLSISPYWVYTQWSQVLSFTTHSSLHFSHFSSKFQKQIMSAPKCCDCEWLKVNMHWFFCSWCSNVSCWR
jgi:hypothetical protein